MFILCTKLVHFCLVFKYFKTLLILQAYVFTIEKYFVGKHISLYRDYCYIFVDYRERCGDSLIL